MTSFTLNTGRGRALSGFQNRTSDVFGSLGGLEKNYDEGVKQRGPDEFVDDDRRSPERGDGFKRPDPPCNDRGRSHREHKRKGGWNRPDWRNRGGRSGEGRHGKRQRTPDHKVHPERWTKYSLEDTDISGESANKRAAIDFLRELRERKAKDQQSEEWDADLHCGKIEFKKPVQKSDDEKGEGERRRVHSDVHRMPEYVIGQTRSKGAKPKKAVAQCSSSSGESSAAESGISLGHLGEDDESDQSEKSSITYGQSERGRTNFDQSKGGKADGQLKGSQSKPEEASGDADITEESSSLGTLESEDRNRKPETVGFQKKGKGKRNIRGRKREDDDN